MNWFVYIPFSTESGWEHLESVENTAKWYSSEGLKSHHGRPSSFNRAWAEAQAAAKGAGWNGVIEGTAVVFWMPTKTGFVHGFSWQQSDGKGVLVSPVQLPHLEDARSKRFAVTEASTRSVPKQAQYLERGL